MREEEDDRREEPFSLRYEFVVHSNPSVGRGAGRKHVELET